MGGAAAAVECARASEPGRLLCGSAPHWQFDRAVVGDPGQTGGTLGRGRPKLTLIRCHLLPPQGLKLVATKIQSPVPPFKLIPAA